MLFGCCGVVKSQSVVTSDNPTTQTTTVGATDNTTAWWNAFSDYYVIGPNQKLTINFTNHSSKEANYHNWLSIVTTDAARAGEGYSEYFVLRADNYGWGGTAWNGANLSSNFNWDSFKTDMDGANIVLSVTRIGARVEVYADITSSDGVTKYYERYFALCGSPTANIRCFLTTEKGHLTGISSSFIDSDVTSYIGSNKGDLSAVINGDFESNADGWSGGQRMYDAGWTTRNWRGTDVNGFYEANGSNPGPLVYTLKNMPAGTYKVVAATHGNAAGTIKPSLAGNAGSAYQLVGDVAVEGQMEINTNGVEMPYSALGGFTTNTNGHRWHWLSQTATLAEAGDLVIKFEVNGGSWCAIDDVHLYCTSLGGTTYCMSANGISTNTMINLNNNTRCVTCDLVFTNPNVIIRTSSEVITAAGQTLNNNKYNSTTIGKLVLYDGYPYSDYKDGDNNIYLANGATFYRNIPAGQWCSLVVPFCPTNLDEKKVPTSLSDAGVLSFGDAGEKDLNNVPMLVKSTAGTTAIIGSRNSTYGVGFGNMNSGAGVTMTGVYATSYVPEGGYVVAHKGDADNLYKVANENSVSLEPFRAYFTIPADEARSIISLNFDDESTGIVWAKSDMQKQESTVVYNMSGQRVQHPTKGLYIINGKKMIFK